MMRIAHATLSLLLAAAALQAQKGGIIPFASRAESRPPALNDVGFDQKLDAQVPLDLAFRDETGRAVRLGDYFGKRPVVLALVYYECPMLCTLSLNGLLRAMRVLSFTAGNEYEVVTVSINPRETPELAAAKKQSYIEKYDRPRAAQGWHFLTGAEESIKPLAAAVGFRYAYDNASGQFAHATGIVLLTPRGRVARYQFGVEYSARDLRLGIIEASANRIGTLVDQALLYCFNYDAATGKYTPAIMNVLRASVVAVMIALVVFAGLSARRNRRIRRQEVQA